MARLMETQDQELIRKLTYRVNALERKAGVIKKEKWYENIPDGGVLCWCGDGESDKESVGQVTEKGGANGYYTASHKHWIYATPLTKQEIQVFMDNVPEDL